MLLIRLLSTLAFISSLLLNYATAFDSYVDIKTPAEKEVSRYYGMNKKGECVRFKLPKGGIPNEESERYRNRKLCLPKIELKGGLSPDEQYRKLMIKAIMQDEEEEKKRILAMTEEDKKKEKEDVQIVQRKLMEEKLQKKLQDISENEKKKRSQERIRELERRGYKRRIPDPIMHNEKEDNLAQSSNALSKRKSK
ncbi:uncharacterized protein LOC128883842 [Hylaeus volcanicus]|uniref:uncharacterized protein LOC128883842 n=1 Tax=Hylaeus volcanicus TaxID=313075 RepID=UPI0023B7BBAF|nr:uncharacterized protein LOC128883842 [Hylaeus volcanicus]